MNANRTTVRQAASDWAARFGEVLRQRTGTALVPRRLTDEKPPEAVAGHIWWTSADGTVTIGIPETDTFLLLGDIAPGEAAASMAALWNDVWQGQGELTSDAPAGEVLDVWELRFSSARSVRLLVREPRAVSDGTPNLDALLDIELPITLRFGSTHMALQDILALNTGSVVEFDGALEDPVEVLVNGHVVARGEAVTVGGSYGVKISEIVSRQDRLMAPAIV